MRRLLDFYIACVEEEDLRSLTLELDKQAPVFISPWEEREIFFSSMETETTIVVEAAGERELLEKWMEGNSTFLYGYPVVSVMSSSGKRALVPLFTTEISVRRLPDKENSFVIGRLEAGRQRLNHHLFDLQPEELLSLRRDLEARDISFQEQLADAFKVLGATGKIPDPQSVNRFTLDLFVERAWHSSPILFPGTVSDINSNLLKDLKALGKYLLGKYQGTALEFLLNPLAVKKPKALALPLVEPASLNESQRLAVRSAMEEPLSVITGPPGTGKSQVVVAILANCIATNQSVLFASKNNNAVDVVRQRLRDILGCNHDWSLRLGNKEKNKKCKSEIVTRLERESSELCAVDSSLPATVESLSTQIRQVEISIKVNSEKQKQYEEAQEAFRLSAAILPESWTACDVQSDMEQLQFIHEPSFQTDMQELLALAGVNRPGIWLAVKKFFFFTVLLNKHRRKFAQRLKNLPLVVQLDLYHAVGDSAEFNSLVDAYSRIYGFAGWLGCQLSLRQARQSVETSDVAIALHAQVSDLRKRQSNATAQMMKVFWTNKIRSRLEAVKQSVSRYFGNQDDKAIADLQAFTEMVADFKVWIVTNLSARATLPLDPGIFDLLVIDEASQCDIASALPLLVRAKRAVIIGDPNQLRHITTIGEDVEKNIVKTLACSQLVKDWSYINLSLYDRAAESLQANHKKPILLAEHFRCHPEIIEFSNQSFYGGKLICQTYASSAANGDERGVWWHHVTGNVGDDSQSASNEPEADEVMGLIGRFFNYPPFVEAGSDVGIVTPFVGQEKLLLKKLREQPWYELFPNKVTVGTVHKFQGDEKDVIVFSPVITEGSGSGALRFAAAAEQPQLLNVAITRPRKRLHVVGDLPQCQKAGGWLSQLADYVQARSQKHQNFNGMYDSPEEAAVAELLRNQKIWFETQVPFKAWLLDFVVVTPFGNRYNIEVDGFQHWKAEQITKDKIRDREVQSSGISVIRISADDIKNNISWVRERLARLA